MKNAVEIRNLNVSYGKTKVLQDVDLNIVLNSRTAIIGANGAGKSTLLKSILGLIKIDGGDIKILDENIDSAKTKIAYVPQKDSVNWDFPTTVYLSLIHI